MKAHVCSLKLVTVLLSPRGWSLLPGPFAAAALWHQYSAPARGNAYAHSATGAPRPRLRQRRRLRSRMKKGCFLMGLPRLRQDAWYDPSVAKKKRWARLPIQFIHRHLRLWIALILGIGSFFLLPQGSSVISRLLISWDIGVLIFLVTIYSWMRGLTAEQIFCHYVDEDPSGPVILVVVIVAAVLSLLAIVEPLTTLRHAAHGARVYHFALAAITLINSWLLVPTMFTMHYADMFYSAPPKDRPLSFPQTDMPAFWDFAYFSFTISAACQTADVSTTRVSIRRVVIFHEVLSFAFNVAIVGFAINITAGLIAA
jgi:uncharacterized membrane protein